MQWIWDDIKKFFIDAAGYIAGKLGLGELVDMRDEFTDGVLKESDTLISNLMESGSINVQQWTLDMRELIKNTYRAQYELAIGGRENMTPADYGRLGGILQEQYRYLQGFADDLAAGRLSPSQAMYRARMYINSSTQAFERARAAGFGLTLPQYPGDGGTQCLTNCKCQWDIQFDEKEFAFNCYWRLGYAEHCPDCLDAAKIYSPYVVQI